MKIFILLLGILFLFTNTLISKKINHSENNESSQKLDSTIGVDSSASQEKKDELPHIIKFPSRIGEVTFLHKEHYNEMEIE